MKGQKGGFMVGPTHGVLLRYNHGSFRYLHNSALLINSLDDRKMNINELSRASF